MFRMLLLSATIAFALSACNNTTQKNGHHMDTEGPVTNVLDTIPPPADEADGLDSRPGYNTTQMSTDVDKDIPIPNGSLNIPPQGMAFLPNGSEVGFSPDIYTYRYLVPGPESNIPENPLQREQPPLFSADCRSDEQSVSCSNAELLEYLRGLSAYSEDGRQLYAVAVINPKGEVERVERVQCAGTLPCSAYESLARRILMNMPAWEPAVLDGSRVSAQVVIPMRIELNS